MFVLILLIGLSTNSDNKSNYVFKKYHNTYDTYEECIEVQKNEKYEIVASTEKQFGEFYKYIKFECIEQ